MVPGDQRGDILYPLNQLRDMHPELYEQYLKKYEGRESVLTQMIEPLDCLWNDVIFLTAVHPSMVKKAYEETGFKFDLPFRFYEIEPEALDPKRATVMLFPEHRSEPNVYRPYSPANIDQYSEFPERTMAYYEAMFSEGVLPLLFLFIPHILYRGTLNVSNLRIIKV
ncbi:MAG: hypothetical protein P4M11_01445 [Candidatus Pacebacteria bacterium]|nr:hypothetical protein [Candidatus Paceibacterota bacterium]